MIRKKINRKGLRVSVKLIIQHLFYNKEEQGKGFNAEEWSFWSCISQRGELPTLR